MSSGGISSDFASVLSLLDNTAALRRAAEVAYRSLGADWAAAAEQVGEDNAVMMRAIIGARTDQLDSLVIEPEHGLGGRAAVGRRPVAVTDYSQDSSITHDYDGAVRAEGLRAIMAAPIVRAHRLYGMLYVARRSPSPWSEEDKSELQGLARQTAIAMEVARSAHEMAEIAVYGDRQRLAVGLHDSIGATLFSLRAALTSAKGSLDLGPAADLIDDALELAQRAATELRRHTLSLNKPPEDKALAVALEGDCREFTSRTGVQAGLVVLGEIPLLSSGRTEVLRLAVREALLNVEKHANARSVVVSLYPQDHGLGLAVADDGSPSANSPNAGLPGMGQIAVTERVERVGGWVTFEVNDGGGRTMRAWVPAANAGTDS